MIQTIAKMLGCNTESQALSVKPQFHSVGMTLHIHQVSSLLLTGSFDSKGKRTKGREKEIPLTNAVLAVNFELDDDIR